MTIVGLDKLNLPEDATFVSECKTDSHAHFIK